MTKLTLSNVGNLIDATTAQTTINANNASIVTALENTLSRDGTTPNTMSAPLDMNSNTIVNLPAPATATSPLRLTDLNSFIGGGTITNIPAGGTTNQVLKKNSNTDYDVVWGPALALAAGTNISITGTSTQTISTITNPTFSSAVLGNASATNLLIGGGSFGANGELIQVNGSTAAVHKAIRVQNSDTGGFSTLWLGTGNEGMIRYGSASLNKLTINCSTASVPITLATASTDRVSISDTQIRVIPTTAATTATDGALRVDGGLSVAKSLVLGGSSSGATVVNASATASGTLTLPAATDTLVGKATTDTFTNKTFNTAGTGNVFQINGTGITAVTGTGSVVLSTTPTFTTSAISPLLIGGTGTGSSLTLQSTSGAGATDQIILKVGNNGAVTGGLIDTVGNFAVPVKLAVGAVFTPAVTAVIRTGTDHNFEIGNSGSGVNIQVLNNARAAYASLAFDSDPVTFSRAGSVRLTLDSSGNTFNSSVVIISDTTTSTSSTTGSLRVGGGLGVAENVFGGGVMSSTGAHTAMSGTAIPAGGTAGSGYKFSSTSNFGIFFGSGAPSLSAAKGSLYLRSDGSTTNDRAYINTNGTTTWTALTTAA